ncbi:MAG: CocE/NonD family hydrolase C-terminal non-catalytic domain-containing protein, partial [Thermodesulfobacteriota bacterium]
KGIDRGVEKDPMLRAWMQDTVNPLLPERPGRWVAEDRWPSARIKEREFFISRRLLVPNEGQEIESEELSIQSPLNVGLFAGKWCSYAEDTDLPWDQREEDGGALIFDTEPLAEDLEILGNVKVDLELSVDKPVAMVAVRLSDVAPNDRATRVTFGILNLTHYKSHEEPVILEPGRRYQVRVQLNYVGQCFPAGHRIRLGISSSYWPLAWPPPEPVRQIIYTGGCCLRLPVRPFRPEDQNLRDLGRPREGPGLTTTLLAPSEREWTVTHNLASNEVVLNVINNDAKVHLDEIGITFGRKVKEKYGYFNNRYDTLRGEAVHERLFERGDWQLYTITRTVLTSTRTHFLIRATLDAYEGDVRFYSKTWDESVPRDYL